MQVVCNAEVVLTELGIPLPARALIDGDWVDCGGVERSVTDPGTGMELAVVRDTSPEGVDAAVASARRAFDGWSVLSVAQRKVTMEQIANVIAANGDALARVETMDTGKPLAQSLSDVKIAERYFRYYGSSAENFFGDSIPINRNVQVTTLREPYGVVAHITPWNAPISQLARGVAPSLAVGNSVVVKPSELAPLSSIMFAALVSRVTPPGLINVIPGDGEVTGNALASHPGIDHITFTGSVSTGVLVAQAAAGNIVASNLELGGKSAAIIFADGDLAAAVKAATGALIRNSGQSCSALTRFIVHRSVVAEFSRLLVENVERLSVGYGLDDRDVGPLISEKQRTRVFGLIHSAIQQGATLLTGSAELPDRDDLQDGYYALPTVLGAVTEDMSVAYEEVFGPVQSVMVFDTEEEAVRIANGTEYGLVAAVFTSDVSVAGRLGRVLQAGQVQVNGYIGAGAEIPFGGYKRSGHGREKGFEALYGYTQLKAIVTHIPDRVVS